MNFKRDFLKTMIFPTLISDTCFSTSIEATELIKKTKHCWYPPIADTAKIHQKILPK